MATEISELGKIICDRPGYESVWVRFKTRGYPFRLRDEWRETNDVGALALILRYVVEWNLPDMDGNAITLPSESPRSPSILDNVEETLIVWFIGAFAQFWRVGLPSAEKNSPAPSPST
mgnify:CR=1 FL=1